jgi:deoxyribonuclease-4
VLERAPGTVPVLLEITAGQGTLLGARLDQLATIIDNCSERERLGVCLDTCHAFAAGYPLHLDSGYEAFFAEVESTVGLASVRCFHLNDSVGALGSRRDRHANLGCGEIGLELFRKLTRDPRLREIPMILETPRGDDGEGHRRDLELLRDPG